MTIEELRNRLELKKQEANVEQDKIEVLESLFEDDAIFFQLDLETAVSILNFLGVPENEIVDAYYSLISPANMPTTYVAFGNQR